MEQRRNGTALHVARRVIDAGLANRADEIEAADLLFERMGGHLGVWIGADGWQLLLKRALAEASQAEPRLEQVSLDSTYRLRWIPVHKAPVPPTAEAYAALLAVVIELLGRIVGSDLAVHLVELGLPEQADV